MLTPRDFGVEMQSEAELRAIKREVEATVGVDDPACALWDALPEDLETAPRLLAAPSLQPHSYVSRVRIVLDGAQGHYTDRFAVNWNLLVTGKRGVGDPPHSLLCM